MIFSAISAIDYLKRYCVLTTRREILYKKIHDRHKDRSGKLSLENLEKALREILVHTITSDDVTRICDVIALNSEDTGAVGVEYKLFAGIAAMAERMLFPRFQYDAATNMTSTRDR